LKVVVTDYIEENLDWEKERLSKEGIELECHQLKFRPAEEVIEKIGDADLVVVNMVKMDAQVISGIENCRVIMRHGIGYDNVDVAACTRHGIVLGYQTEYCKDDVAEHAIALILSCARKIVRSRKTLEDSSDAGQWDFSDIFPLYRLKGKTLGIVGVGRIGSIVCARLSSFGFTIIGCDPYLSDKRMKDLDIEFVDRHTLFSRSDFVTVHTPLNDETRHIVNAKTLGLMKPTAYVINTSRGPMVDTDALADALKSGTIAGAAIDVYDVEPPPPDFPLFGIENVILTPHTAWASHESGWDIRKSIVEDIIACAGGGLPKYIVNKEVSE